MMAQYFEVKAKHPDFLLFYRMGDFFELFFEDAVKAAEALGIQLTKRGKHSGEDIPMCGVPVSRADDYLQKLIRKGFRVAVAEQLEDAELAKKRGPKAVVKRDVVRLVTPGTLTEDALLPPGSNNFLTAVTGMRKGGHGRYSLASLDISTGEFLLGDVACADIEGELARLRPAEILVSEHEAADETIKRACEAVGAAIAPLAEACFSKTKGAHALRDAFGVSVLDGLGTFSEGELSACGALLHYVALTQMGERPAISAPKREAGVLVVIDAGTRASLELVRPRHDGAPTVFSAIDCTVTAAGARELTNRLLSPLTDPEPINHRLEAVSVFFDNAALRERVRRILKRAPDMSRALSRLKLKRGNPRDLGTIRDGLQLAGDLAAALDALESPPEALKANLEMLIPFRQPSQSIKDPSHGPASTAPIADEAALAAALAAALGEKLPLSVRDGSFIAPGYDAKLDELRELASGSMAVLAKLQATYSAQTGVKSLKIQYNQVFGYFIEVGPASAPALQAGQNAAQFRHRQTLANAIRFTTDELSALEGRILNANNEALERELQLFDRLANAVLRVEGAISAAAGALAALDCTAALAELAHRHNYVRPKIDDSRHFLIEGGRHPAVEQALKREGTPFIGNDCKLDGLGEHAPGFLVVTGPNMAGKSTYLRQNALIVVLAQMGSYVPASFAHIGVVDRLFARIGSADDLARGRSTFMVEMTETAAILNQATAKSLVILDEIGRGTATFDGLSIAWAVLEHLHDVIRCRGLIATHYHELTRLAESLPRAGNVRMAVTEWRDAIVFLHAVEKGAAHRSYGVQAARLAGVPKPVLARAKDILARLESGQGPNGPMTLPTDMPLFALAPQEEAERTQGKEAPHPALEMLRDLDADALSPREALDAIYTLKSFLRDDNGPAPLDKV